MNKNYTNNMSQKDIFQKKYNAACSNLLLVVIFSAINLLLLVTNAGVYFLFSAFIPYFLTSLGMLMCGKYPEDYYTGEFAGMEFVDEIFFTKMLIISIIIVIIYFVTWLVARKSKVGWLVFAFILFAVDTIGMFVLNGISLESIFDILFHGWVIYSLVVGINAYNKLKLLPEEVIENTDVFEEKEVDDDQEESSNSKPLRVADMNVKQKVLLQTKVADYDICYRRVKHTNELVINGNVYDEIIGVVEYAHTLNAILDGHLIQVGFTGTHSIIMYDQQQIAKKLRLF